MNDNQVNEIKKKNKFYLFILSFFMSLSMFTRIPSIVRRWEEDAKKYMIIWLPFIGAIIGGIWMLEYYLLSLINLPALVNGLLLALYPFLITGFIHFDGFLDCSDAIHSYRPVEERIRILKDPHCGSFAICYGIVLMLSFYIGMANIGEHALFFLLFIPIISRIMSGLVLALFPTISVSEYHNDEDNKKNRIIRIIYFIILLIGILLLAFFIMNIYVIAVASIILFHLIATLICYKSFKGINGDVTGYALTISETLCLFVFILLEVLL